MATTTTESSSPQHRGDLTAAGTLDSDFDTALQLQSPNEAVPIKIPDEFRDEGSSKDLNDDEVFRVYFKGMMNEERIGDDSSSTVTLAGIGVGICNDKDEVIYELRKPLGENELSMRGVECKALIEGLNVAIDLGLKRIVLYFDYYPLYQFVTGNWSSKQRNIAPLLNQVARLTNKFTYCGASFVARNDIKYAFKLARDAISSQVKKPEESISAEKETCEICFEDSNINQIFSVDNCTHRYCFSCMKQHIEAKLFNGSVPKCPHEDCNSELRIDSCGEFLPPNLIEIMKVQVKEASIPVGERIYCPYPKCSALMSKREVLEHHKSEFGGAMRCVKCFGEFCINCKVVWHSNMTCTEYEGKNLNHHAEDAKLKTLAASNLWRQCEKCSHMIELSAGCHHMTCRCGYEFCYNCGAEWNDETATCDCPLYSEDVLYNGDETEDELYEYESDEDEEDDDEDENDVNDSKSDD
ncbi:hypothetical protein LguiA_021103 [Lonicera macranthoides]